MPGKIKRNRIKPRVGLIVGLFNLEVTQKLLEGALSVLDEAGLKEDARDVFWVPGAIELPVTAQRLAMSGRYKAIIALGSVIRGETSHYHFVCEQVSGGCQRVALDHSIPVIFGVLTTDNKLQALERVGGAHGHKGKEAASAALAMIELMSKIEAFSPPVYHD